MNKAFFHRARGKRKSRGTARTRSLLFAYFLSVIGFIVVYFLALYAAYFICRNMITWYSGDPLYEFLLGIYDNIVLISIIALILGTLVISALFIASTSKRLDELSNAATKLAKPDETPITLSSGLKDVENELNLAREQALRSAFAAKEAEQRKNDLVVYLAHDLKTPLTSVIGYLTLLKDEPQLSPEFRARYTGIALDKAERLETLINEFFEITRFNLSDIELEYSTVSLSIMLEQLVSEFQPVLKPKGLSCLLLGEPGITLSCDPDKLSRVFDNLLRNAVNYSYENTEITVSASADENEVTVVFTNHGATIPPEKLGRIFERFYRLDSSRSTAAGGAGLGLAIAKQLVTLHKGTITAKSEKELTTFTVTLPREPG